MAEPCTFGNLPSWSPLKGLTRPGAYGGMNQRSTVECVQKDGQDCSEDRQPRHSELQYISRQLSPSLGRGVLPSWQTWAYLLGCLVWVAEPLWASFPHLYIGGGDNDTFLIDSLQEFQETARWGWAP